MNLDTLLQRRDIWRGGRLSAAAPSGLPTGFGPLDAALPGGGWPQGALTEILTTQEGIGELRLILPALARLSRGNRWIAWIAPPRLPYAPALAAAEIDLSRVLLVSPHADTDALWATEQALRSGTCATVLAWPRQPNDRTLRRLQLAAETGKTCGFLFHCTQDAGTPSPVALRLRLEPATHGLSVNVLKCRGGFVTGPIALPFAPLPSS
ncbi:MAG: translesion DNA synthesis-associated protein ImuA [Gammaproteobacteria bacterium]|nr:MAG: translesion DNA synthesis-associated protein ImuA [Gammaproteobacteria bacterium]